MPWLRSPAGAPVPVLAQPTSRYTVEGGVQVANVAGEIAGLGIQRRWNEIDQPAPDPNAVRQTLGLGRRRGFARIAGQRLLVHVDDVGEIEQVIDEKLIVRLQVDVAGRCRPRRIGEPEEVRNLRLVGLGRLSHPDPHRAPLLAYGVAPDLGTARDHGLSRHLDALPVDVVFQPVIAAREVVAGHFAPRERRCAMAATVLQRGGLAAGVAEQHYFFVEKGSPDRARLQIIRPDRGVPAIAQEHERPPTVTSNRTKAVADATMRGGMLEQIYDDCRRRPRDFGAPPSSRAGGSANPS